MDNRPVTRDQLNRALEKFHESNKMLIRKNRRLTRAAYTYRHYLKHRGARVSWQARYSRALTDLNAMRKRLKRVYGLMPHIIKYGRSIDRRVFYRCTNNERNRLKAFLNSNHLRCARPVKGKDVICMSRKDARWLYDLVKKKPNGSFVYRPG